MKRIYLLSGVTVLLCVLLLACKLYSPCAIPKRIEKADVIGVWHLTYAQHYVSNPIEGSLVVSGTTTYLIAPNATPMSLEECEKGGRVSLKTAWEQCPLLRSPRYPMEGEERIILFEDGTYQQFFVSGAYSYTSPLNRWELITDTPDGPKLQMQWMKYFAEGIAQANSYINILIGPQMSDQLRVQKYKEATQSYQDLKTWVTYPGDGFVYLYPRLCDGKLSLVQMAFKAHDPDNMTVRNPVFKRTGR